MVMKQREIGREGSLVMEGRDIGTNVFPDSPLKFYIDASPQARAERRVKQLISQGIKANYDEILSLIIERDEQDSRRKYNPLKKADDAHYIDTTNMTQSEVVKKMLSLFKENIS
jgi:cytidylate kinase